MPPRRRPGNTATPPAGSAPERPPRGRSGGGAPGSRGGGSLPKPPQGHAGYEQKIKRKPPRRDGTPPRYANQGAKQKMLASTIEAASERGYESMRISDITDRVGVTRQAFYIHFRDKRHCLAEAIDPRLGAIERMTASLSESDSDSAARIAHALDDVLAERFGSAEGTRGRILSAIGRLLAAPSTLHEITIGQIVKEAHVPQGDFYRQFSTKRECFSVHYELLLGELVAEVEEAAAPAEVGEPVSGRSPGECPAEHTRHELPALLRALGEALAADPQRLRVLIVESAHLPEISDADQPGAWRGSLTDAIASLLASSQGAEEADPRIRWLAASAHELIRSAALSAEAGGLPGSLAGLGSGYAPGMPEVSEPLAA